MSNLLYQGIKKTLHSTKEGDHITIQFNDNIRLPSGKILTIGGKGIINNSISAFIMEQLTSTGINTHFLRKLNMRKQAVLQAVEVFPFKVCVSNIACMRYVKELALPEGYVFDKPLIEFKLKNTERKYPPINENQLIGLKWITAQELKEVKNKTIRIFDFLNGLFRGAGMRLVYVNLEFGLVITEDEWNIMLIDEISPDNCMILDLTDNTKLGLGLSEDKEEKDLNEKEIIKAYNAIAQRFNISLGQKFNLEI